MTNRAEKVAVRLVGGSPWGFRLQGGAGTGSPLVVSKVRRKSKAYRHLHEGDIIVNVNGRSCDKLTYDQVMEIADKNGADLTLEIIRHESNKENLAPSAAPTSLSSASESLHKKDVVSTKELRSCTKETTTKVIEETEGLRIKPSPQLPDNSPLTFDNLKSNEPVKCVEAFPAYAEVVQAPVFSKPMMDRCTTAKTQEVSGDDDNFTKVTTETTHEVKGNTETSIFKKEQESFSKTSSGDVDGLPGITLDTIDLNNLIAETQKKLDSFKNGLSTDVSVKTFDVKKPELTQSIESKVNAIETTTTTNMATTNAERPKETMFTGSTVNFQQGLNKSTDNHGFSSSDVESTTVTTENPYGITLVTKKKKMFSSSSFYEEPYAIYPTVEEQVEMAKKIADSLADDTNRKSKGANMFFKRVKRSTKWIHEGPEPSDESSPGTPEYPGMEPPTPDPSVVPWKTHKGPAKLKLVLDPRHILDATALRSSGYVISEHNVVSPEMCHHIVKDLHSPVGKGAALFAKRKKKSEEWVVDEEKVKALMREREKNAAFQPPTPSHYATRQMQSDVKLVKTPWAAAMESPYGSCDGAFARVHPDHLADTVIKAADSKLTNSVEPILDSAPPISRLDDSRSPAMPPLTHAAAQYNVYGAKAPRGWTGSAHTVYERTPSVLPPITTSNVPVAHYSLPVQNGYPGMKKMAFQNFNAVPRLWKKT